MIPEYSALFDQKLIFSIAVSGLIASMLIAAKETPKKIFMFIKRRLISTVTVDSTCEAYHLLNEWIEGQDFAKKSRSLMLENIKSSSRAITTSSEDEFMSKRLSSWRISMSAGTYLFWHQGTLFFYTKLVKEQGAAKLPIYHSTLVGFTRNRQKVIDILEYCHKLLVDNNGTISIYSYHGYWQLVERRKTRSLDTIFLREGQIERICADIEWFYRSAEWYAARGIPYRRGYLFEGPHGTGKTSSIIGFATFFKKSIALLNLSSLTSDKDLMEAILNSPKDSFIVLEDVDCATATGRRVPVEEKKAEAGATPVPVSGVSPAAGVFGITTSGLLNALDGITTPENRLYFLTTNHPDKIDPALIRPGRVDVREHIGLIPKVTQERMATSFYVGYLAEDGMMSNEFIGLDTDVAPAELMRVLMLHPSSPEKAKAELVEAEMQ